MSQKKRVAGDPPGTKKAREETAKALALISAGMSDAEASRQCGHNIQWVYNWKQDDWFRNEYEIAAGKRTGILAMQSGTKIPFIEFRKVILGRHTFPHMRQWAEWFESDENDHILILCPPETAKTTFVLDYILWRIYLDPNIRVGYVSRSLPHSIKQVSKLRNIIEQNRTYNTLCGGNLVPGPGAPHPWRDTYFTVAAREWQAGMDEADYTVAAFGAGSQITGSRFDLLIFDDPDDVNIGRADREKVWNVVLQAGETRLGVAGRMIVIGNRQDEEDVYRLILDQWTEEPDLWAVYTQAAVQEWDKDGYPTKVIWPEKFGMPREARNAPVSPDGEWNHDKACTFFSRKSRRLGHRFFLVYQNDPLADRQKDFTREMVDSALDADFSIGSIPAGSVVIASMDPAPTGGAAVLVYALLPPDREGVRRRLLVDFEWGTNWRHSGVVERIRHYGEKYRPKWWVIERSATTKLFLEDQAIVNMIFRQGAWLYDLTTGTNKDALDFGVSSLRDLFIGTPTKIILPGKTPKDKEVTKVLRDQLVDYHPGITAAHDGPMALWFAERLITDKHLLRYGMSKDVKQMTHWRSPNGAKWTGGSWSFKKPADLKPDQGLVDLSKKT